MREKRKKNCNLENPCEQPLRFGEDTLGNEWASSIRSSKQAKFKILHKFLSYKKFCFVLFSCWPYNQVVYTSSYIFVF